MTLKTTELKLELESGINHFDILVPTISLLYIILAGREHVWARVFATALRVFIKENAFDLESRDTVPLSRLIDIVLLSRRLARMALGERFFRNLCKLQLFVGE